VLALIADEIIDKRRLSRCRVAVACVGKGECACPRRRIQDTDARPEVGQKTECGGKR
jgi:hypothetical protein